MDAYLLPPYAAGDKLDADDLIAPDRKITQGTYTPTFTSGAPAVAIGASGFLTGAWHRTGLLIEGWVDILVSGVGSNVGGTSHRIGLPFDADLTLHPVGVLNAASHNIADFQTSSGTAAQALSGSGLISAVAELVFYSSGSTTSIGGANFTTTARWKVRFSYVADAAEF